MSQYYINIQEPYLRFVLKGKKDIEGRLNKGKFKFLQKGDFLIIKPDNQKFIIKEINYYKTFKDMIKDKGIKRVIPDKESIEQAVNVYYNFYTKEQEKKFGVIAITIEQTQGF